MTTNEIIATIESLRSIEELIREAEAEVETLKDTLKAEMTEKNLEEMEVGHFIVRWTPTLSNRFDSTAFKKVMPDVYKAYTKQISSRRFSIS